MIGDGRAVAAVFRFCTPGRTALVLTSLTCVLAPGVAIAHGTAAEPLDPGYGLVTAGLFRGGLLAASIIMAGLALFIPLVWIPVAGPSYALRHRLVLWCGGLAGALLALTGLRGPGAGWSDLARTGLALALVAVLPQAAARGTRAANWGAMGLGTALLMTVSLQAHALEWTHILVVWLHLTGAAAWVGGLVGFPLVVWPTLGSLLGSRRSELIQAAVRRFSRMAIAAVAVLILTGLLALLPELPELGSPLRTAFGRILAVKLVLVVPMLVLGAYNLVRRGGGRFRLAVLTEAGLAVGVLVAAGFLGVAGGVEALRSGHSPLVAELPAAAAPAGEPTWVALHFTSPLYRSSGLRVVNAQGARVHPGVGAPVKGDPSVWLLDLPGLTPGPYLLEWDALSDRTGERMQGSYPFVVRNAVTGEAPGAGHGAGHGGSKAQPAAEPVPRREVGEVPLDDRTPGPGPHPAGWGEIVAEVLLAIGLAAQSPGLRRLVRWAGLAALGAHVLVGARLWAALNQVPFSSTTTLTGTVLPWEGEYGRFWIAKSLLLVLFLAAGNWPVTPRALAAQSGRSRSGSPQQQRG